MGGYVYMVKKILYLKYSTILHQKEERCYYENRGRGLRDWPRIFGAISLSPKLTQISRRTDGRQVAKPQHVKETRAQRSTRIYMPSEDGVTSRT